MERLWVTRMKNNNQEVIRLISRRERACNKWENRILTGTMAFAVWMLCCVFSLAAGRIRAEELLLIRNAGTKAVTTLENPSGEQYQVLQSLSYIESAGMETDFASADAFLCTVLDQTAWEKLQKPAYTDVCGTYPQEADELMLPIRALKSMGIEHPKIGMQIPVEMTDGEGKTKYGIFRLCGYYTEYVDPMAGKPYGYFSEAYLEQLCPKTLSRTLLMEQRADMDWATVERRLYEDVPMRDDSQQFFGGNSIRLNIITKVAGGYGTAFGMASVICFAAWLLLGNVLQISFGKSVRRFGLLKTLGTTDRQIRKIIWRQTVRSALAGCLIGSGAGAIVTVTCVPAFLSRRYLHGFGNASVMLAFRPEIFALSMCIGFCIALFGTLRVIRKLGTLSPIESAHYMEHFSVRMQTGGQMRHPLPAMAWRNLIRFPKRFTMTILSLTLGICVGLTAVVVVNGTDRTNEIKSENHDFKIMTNLSAGMVGQYPQSDSYFPEELQEKMTGLQGVTNAERVEGGYGRLRLQEKILELRQDVSEVETGWCEFVVQQVSAEYLEALRKLSAEKDLGLDVDAVENGTGAIMLHYNLFSKAEEERGKQYVGETFSVYDLQKEKMAELNFSGYLNFREKGLPRLDTTWNGPGMVYFLVSREGMERIQIPLQTFVLELDVDEAKEPAVRESVRSLVDRYNGMLAVGGSQGNYITDARTLAVTARSELLSDAENEIASSRIVMYALCLILLLMGITNYGNVMIAGFFFRKKELAVMSSIGMTDRQMRNMLLLEGLFYVLIVGGLVLTAGSGLLYGTGVLMRQRLAYFRFCFPWRELLAVFAGLCMLCMALPAVLFRTKFHPDALRGQEI